MNRQETLDQLVSWLREISTDFSLEESSLNSTTVFVAKMYTDNNRYSIVCRLDEDGEPFIRTYRNRFTSQKREHSS